MAVTALATCSLVLYIRGTLGTGTLRMYLSLRVPTHPFRVLGLLALGNAKGEFLHISITGAQQYDVPLGGVYSGNRQDSFCRGSI